MKITSLIYSLILLCCLACHKGRESNYIIKITRSDIVRDSKLYNFIFTSDTLFKLPEQYSTLVLYVKSESIMKLIKSVNKVPDNSTKEQLPSQGYQLCITMNSDTNNIACKDVTLQDGYALMTSTLHNLQKSGDTISNDYSMFKMILMEMDKSKNPAWPSPIIK